MGIFNWIDRWVYNHTKKPAEYRRVENPPKTVFEKLNRPQEARQQQFNNWCKRHGVYNGSYLPDDPNALTRKGWKETTSTKNQTGKHRDFQRKSTGQMVRFDDKEFKKGRVENEHYHWENATSISERRKLKDENRYIDRYGKICEDGSPQSHLAPKDRDYNFRK